MSQRVFTEENVARVFAMQGIFPSGSMVCVPETIVISDPIKPPLIPPIVVEPLDQGRAQK